MQGNAPMHPGQGPGLSLHDLGEIGGSETVTLLQGQMPAHGHPWNVQAGELGEDRIPTGEALARSVGGNLYGAAANLVTMAPQLLAPAGGDQSHNNMMPYLTLSFCIALQGVFPPRG